MSSSNVVVICHASEPIIEYRLWTFAEHLGLDVLRLQK